MQLLPPMPSLVYLTYCSEHCGLDSTLAVPSSIKKWHFQYYLTKASRKKSVSSIFCPSLSAWYSIYSWKFSVALAMSTEFGIYKARFNPKLGALAFIILILRKVEPPTPGPAHGWPPDRMELKK